ncbi:GDSL esterase/lipase At5g22810 [Striga asiatica]|uniref:GDSL esterase/lipase At5g22810 n=1 Tax=Striga asiatica TaxID=4170 RepID=A0A5A7RE06_STRAF|nr:GDSL esterase/lipase At5g22810 [Striga asiatica]
MITSSINIFNILLILFCLAMTNAQPLVPALIIFGDSVVDVGNNNNLETIVKADFPPYGRDFIDHKPTGRFCNGKLASDYTAENLGFTSYPQPYLSKQATGKNLLIGANFASGSSGYYDTTAEIYNTIPLSKQLELYKGYQRKLVALVGKSNATSIVNGSIHFVSAGSSDFVQNYYINPLLYKKYSTEQFSDILLQFYTKFVKELYSLGARRIGVTTLPPLGCLPAVITIFGEDSNECVEKINKAAISFNNKLNITSQKLQANLSSLNLVVLDIYQPLLDLVTKPTDHAMSVLWLKKIMGVEFLGAFG